MNIKNELNDAVQPNQLYIVYKNSSGEIVDFNNKIIYLNPIPSNFSSKIKCIKPTKYRSYVKQLRKEKLINRKLENVENFIEVRLKEISIGDGYIRFEK